MRTKVLSAVVIAAVALVAAACGDDGEEAEDTARGAATTLTQGVEEVTQLTANLTGAAEVPGPGDPDGTGTANLNLDVTEGELCYEVSVEQIDRPVAMHIHEAEEGKSGDIVVPLNTPTATDTTTTGCTDVDVPLMGRISGQPDNFYVNVHTETYPQGAVRGQLSQ